MLKKILKKKTAIKYLSLIAVGLLALFMVPACDGIGPNPGGTPTPGVPVVPEFPPFEPVEPATPWVAGTVNIDVYTFNDFHGTVDNSASSSNPGAPIFYTAAKRLLDASEHHMLLAAGDNYQGSALSNYFLGEPVSVMMKELGVRYSVIGNHEWDWGEENYAKFARDANISFITANIFLKGTDKRPDFCHPYVISNIAGRRIGIIGLTTPSTPQLVTASLTEKYDFKDAGDWLKDMVDDLRNKQNCDAVIALTHMGSSGSGTGISGEVRSLTSPVDMGFDAIITGHTHQNVNGTSNGVPVIQASYNGRAIGRLRLTFSDHQLTNIEPGLINVSTSDLPDPEIDAMIASYDDKIAPIMNEVVGKFGSSVSLGKNGWANKLVFDYIVRKSAEPGWRAGPGWEDVVLIQNAGGWRNIAMGGANDDVNVRLMWTLMPFDNEIYLFLLRGDHLMNLLSGKPVTGTGTLGSSAVITNAEGSGTTWTVSSSGEKIDPTKYYKVSMNDFMFSGGDNFGVEGYAAYASNSLILGIPLRNAMIDQLRYRAKNGETSVVGQTIGTLTGGPLVHEYKIKDANTRYVEDTALIHLINDAMLYYTQSYNTTLTGTAPLSATVNAEPGPLTRSSMEAIYTYDNTLYVIQMTGNEFKDWMEWASYDYHRTNMKMGDLTVPYGGGTGYNFDQFDGLTYQIDLTKDEGQRIVNMKNKDGSAFDLAKTYNVAINNHRVNNLILANPKFSNVKILGQNVDSTLTVNGATISNSNGMKGLLADYIERVKDGAITNEFTPSWSFIMPGSDQDWYPGYRERAVELLNNGTLTFSATRPVTITDVRDFMPDDGSSPQPPADLFPPAKPPVTAPLFVDFEDSAWYNTGYSSRTVSVGGVEWKVSGVGSMDANDRYIGSRSIRFRGNSGDACGVELNDFLTTGIQTVSFKYASYSSHSNGKIVFYYLVKGSSGWVNGGTVTAPAWDAATGMLTATYTVNTTSPTRIKIVREGSLANSTSVNIDDIDIK